MPNHDTLDHADDWWRSSAERALQWWADSGQPFDAYDLTQLGVPDPDHPARWGALFRRAYDGGLIVPVGYRQSRRPTRSGGACRVWSGTRSGPESGSRAHNAAHGFTPAFTPSATHGFTPAMGEPAA